MSSEEDINADNSPESPGNSKDNALFEPKPKPKLIRVLTVFAYILSVSMAAILLSIYYIFMWNEQTSEPRKSDESNNDSIVSRSMLSFTYSMEEDNITTSQFAYITDGYPQREMQQQITAVEEKELLSASTPTTDENTTWPDFELSSEVEFGKTSTFIKKLMHKYPYAEND